MSPMAIKEGHGKGVVGGPLRNFVNFLDAPTTIGP